MEKKLLLLIIFACFKSITVAQDYKPTCDSALFFIRKNDFTNAIPYLEKSKRIVNSLPLDTNAYIEILKLLSVSYAKTHKLKLAEESFNESILLLQKLITRKQQLVSVFSNFAVFYYNQKKYTEALEIFEKALISKKSINDSLNLESLYLLSHIASCQVYLKKYSLAEKNYQTVIENRRNLLGGNHYEFVQSLNSLASLYKTIGNYEKALENYLEVEVIIKLNNGEKSKQYGVACVNLGQAYKYLGKYTEAQFYLNIANSVFQASLGENSQDYIHARLQLAGIYCSQGLYTLAESLYLKCENTIKIHYGTNSLLYATYLNDIGLFYSETGKYELAETAYKSAIEITKQLLGEVHPEMALSLSNLGLLYKLLDRYSEADFVFNKAKHIYKETLGENNLNYTTCLNNLGSLNEITGQYALAEPYYKEALQIIKNTIGENNFGYASNLNKLAGVYEFQRKYAEAEPLYKQALQITKETYGETHPAYIAVLNKLALLLGNLNKKNEAETLYKHNITTIAKVIGTSNPVYATAINNHAVFLETRGKYTEAQEFLFKSLLIKHQTLGDNHPSYSATLYDLAKHYTAMHNYTEADKFWNKVIHNYLFQIESFFPSMSEKDKIHFYQNISPVFEQFNSYCLLRMATNPTILTKMYDNQLATKALLFNSSNRVKNRILNSGDFMMTQKYKKWTEKKQQLFSFNNMSVEEQKQQNYNVETLHTTISDLEKELITTSELFKTASDNQKITWRDVHTKLKKDEAAIELIRFNKFRFDSAGMYINDSIIYAALILTAHSAHRPEIAIFSNGAELEKQYLRLYRNAIQNKIDDNFSYSQYWARIKKHIPMVKKVYFSPDGVYNLLNLNTLKNIHTNTYLWDELDIRVLTDTKDILAIRKESSLKKKMVLIGNPDFSSAQQSFQNSQALTRTESVVSSTLLTLSGTKTEIEKISNVMQSQACDLTTYTEKEASEENLKMVYNPTYLHIATHAFFDEERNKTNTNIKKRTEILGSNPLFKSGLLLAGASSTLLQRKNENMMLDTINKKEDGILTAYETMNLQLDQTDLVVLSACETGLDEVSGEGVYSLQKAFHVAGVNTLVISLWAVDDAAVQKLMTSFYKEMQTPNITKRDAFRNAQKTLKTNFTEPHFWGAFVMVGN
jgi:CHAT domain-containing protein